MSAGLKIRRAWGGRRADSIGFSCFFCQRLYQWEVLFIKSQRSEDPALQGKRTKKRSWRPWLGAFLMRMGWMSGGRWWLNSRYRAKVETRTKRPRESGI